MPAPVVPLPVTAVTTALFSLFNLRLSWGVVSLRQSKKVNLGTGGHDSLDRAIRAHGNFCEYAPWMVLELAMLEINGCPKNFLMGLATVMGLARYAHWIGILDDKLVRYRQRGILTTVVTMTVGAVANVWYARGLFGL